MRGPSGADRIVCVGDVANDIVVVPDGAIRDDTDTPARIRRLAGGSAANTAAWLGRAGVPVDLVGCVGAADAGLHEELLRRSGVTPRLHVVQDAETTTIVVVVEGEHRSMLTDRGASRMLRQEMVGDALLAAAGILHVTGHHLADGADAARDLAALVERAHAQGARVSISPGSAGVIADCGADRVARAIAGADLVFANLDEAVALAGPGEPAALAAALADRHGIAVLTRRSGDVLVAERGGAVGAVPVSAARVIDPTGAGDALIAGFLEAWRDDPDPARAAEAGVRRASEAVAVLGGRPMVPR